MPIPIRGRAGLAILAIGTAAIAACSGSSSAWTPAVALPGAAGATLNGITTGTTSSSPFVAVGTVPAKGEVEHAAVWTSPDGTAWSQAPDIADFGQAQMLAVAVGPLGYMAVGARCSTGECGSNAIWTSSDGTTWTRTDGIPTVDGVNADSRTVIAGGLGWIVGGTTFDSGDLRTRRRSGRRATGRPGRAGRNPTRSIRRPARPRRMASSRSWRRAPTGSWRLARSRRAAAIGPRCGHRRTERTGLPWTRTRRLPRH